MDNICNSVGSVDIGDGFLIYHGGLYSRSVSNSCCNCNHQADTGKKSCLTLMLNSNFTKVNFNKEK